MVLDLHCSYGPIPLYGFSLGMVLYLHCSYGPIPIYGLSLGMVLDLHCSYGPIPIKTNLLPHYLSASSNAKEASSSVVWLFEFMKNHWF
jgi:hypothetical protein